MPAWMPCTPQVGMTGSVVAVASVVIAGLVGAEIPTAAAVLLRRSVTPDGR
jgi:predicted membrane-bound spermidine synthase